MKKSAPRCSNQTPSSVRWSSSVLARVSNASIILASCLTVLLPPPGPAVSACRYRAARSVRCAAWVAGWTGIAVNALCVITTASQSPVAHRAANSFRARASARSSRAAIRIRAEGNSRLPSRAVCSSRWFGTMISGLLARPSSLSLRAARNMIGVLPVPDRVGAQARLATTRSGAPCRAGAGTG